MSVDTHDRHETNDPQDARPPATPTSLSTAAARNLASTTKSAPQMQGISSRWLVRKLPWVSVPGGTYRVNRRLAYTLGDGKLTFVKTGSTVRVVPARLVELPLLRGFDEPTALAALADAFEQREYDPGEVIVTEGGAADHVYLIAHGRVEKSGSGRYGEDAVLGRIADGDSFGGDVLSGADQVWEFTARAITATTVLALPQAAYQALLGRHDGLRAHVERLGAAAGREANDYGEAAIALLAGHRGEPTLPGTFVDYELDPREYELSVAQTVLRVHSRVADLYNNPMDQTREQLRLTIEALRERQERELVNNPEFGLLHNAEFNQRISTHSGPPTPDDLDELLSMRRDTDYVFAHPKAIAAFGRECNRRGLYFGSGDGHPLSWRGVRVLPTGKLKVGPDHTTSMLAMRTGEEKQGVVGLYQTGLPGEVEPGLCVRQMGIDDKAVISYLVSVYFSAAVLVPDALGILENVEVHRHA